MFPEEVGKQVWVLLALPFAVLVVATSLSLVPAGRRLVVTRRGLVRRVAEHRLVLRWPLLEQVSVESRAPQVLGLTVRACTADGSDVRVLVELVVQVDPPCPGEPVRRGWSPTARVVEALVAESVGAADVADLPDALERRLPEIAVRAGAVERATRVHGLRVAGLEVLLVDAGSDARTDAGTGDSGPG